MNRSFGSLLKWEKAQRQSEMNPVLQVVLVAPLISSSDVGLCVVQWGTWASIQCDSHQSLVALLPACQAKGNVRIILKGYEPAAGWIACRGFDELASRLPAVSPAVYPADNPYLLSRF